MIESMRLETLQQLIGGIRFAKIVSKRHSDGRECWRQEDEETLYKLIATYGVDYSLFKHFLPQYSRQQIRHKFERIERKYGKALRRAQAYRQQEERKNYFDDEILELIHWSKKPNPGESTDLQQ